MYSPLMKITYIYTDLYPTPLEQFLRAIWGAVSQAIVLILPPIKLNWREMKISPAISINKKSHSHQRFPASRCEWGLPKWNTVPVIQMLPSSTVIAEELGDGGGGWGVGYARSSHLPHLPLLLKMNQETGFGPRELRCMWKGWIRWAQRLASSHT